MKKLLIAGFLLLSMSNASAGFFGGIGNLVTDAVQIPIDAVDTTASLVTLGGYNGTHTLPRYTNEGYVPVYSNGYSY